MGVAPQAEFGVTLSKALLVQIWVTDGLWCINNLMECFLGEGKNPNHHQHNVGAWQDMIGLLAYPILDCQVQNHWLTFMQTAWNFLCWDLIASPTRGSCKTWRSFLKATITTFIDSSVSGWLKQGHVVVFPSHINWSRKESPSDLSHVACIMRATVDWLVDNSGLLVYQQCQADKCAVPPILKNFKLLVRIPQRKIEWDYLPTESSTRQKYDAANLKSLRSI